MTCLKRLTNGQTGKTDSLKELLPLSVTLQSLPVLHVTRFITRPGLSAQVFQIPALPESQILTAGLTVRGRGGEWFRGRLEFRHIYLIEVGFLVSVHTVKKGEFETRFGWS